MKKPKVGKILIRLMAVLGCMLFLVFIMICIAEEHGAMSGVVESRFCSSPPSIDGRISSGEWTEAKIVSMEMEFYDLTQNLVETHPAKIYLMNSSEDLFVGLTLEQEEHDGKWSEEPGGASIDVFMILFDGNDDGVFGSGEDKRFLGLIEGTSVYIDQHDLSDEEERQGKEEEDKLQHGEGAISHSNAGGIGDYTVEFRIPLSTGDEFDINAKPGEKIKWNLAIFDKFGSEFDKISLGTLSGPDIEESSDWGYLALADVPSGKKAPTSEVSVDKALQQEKTSPMVIPKGNRLLDIGISPAEELDEVESFSLARSRVGINAGLVGGSWPEIETAPGKFNYPGLKSANSVYKDVKVIIELNPIESFIRTVPSDLETVPFDDPVMIARYKKLLDVVFSQLPDLHITALWIGNEVTGYLDKTGEWDAYQTFYETVGAYARSIRPGIKIGSAGMIDDWNNITESELKKAKALNQSSDIIVFTCYPLLGNVKNAFDALTSRFAGRPIHIKEIGCPSSTRVGSSEEKQREFVTEVFRAWDEHASQIEHLSFHALHDFPKELVSGIFELMDMSEDKDVALNMEIMTSYGLRTYTGKGRDKLAFHALIQEAKARGWIAGLSAAQRRDTPWDIPLLAPGNHLTIQRSEEFKFSPAVEAELNAKWDNAVAKGMDIAMVGVDWVAVEPAPGVYDKTNLEEPLKACKAQGIQPALLLTTIDSNGYYAMPAEFVDPTDQEKLADCMRIDDPKIIARYKALLDWVVPMLLKYDGFILSIANEPECIFGTKPEEQQQFVNFLVAIREHTRTITKDLPVTATLTRAVLTGDLDNVIAECDVAYFNYYGHRDFGQDNALEPEPASMVSQRIDELLAVAKGRQLLLQETGMSSGYEDKPSTINCTPEMQSVFFDKLIAKLETEPRFRAACAFLMPDMPEEFSDAMEQLHIGEGLPKDLTTRIRESYATLGICRNTDGSGKPAWNTFLAGLDTIYGGKDKTENQSQNKAMDSR